MSEIKLEEDTPDPRHRFSKTQKLARQKSNKVMQTQQHNSFESLHEIHQILELATLANNNR